MSDLILDNDISSEENGLSSNSIKYLKEIAKWAKFLSIIGFIGLGIMVLISIWGLIGGATINSSFRSAGFGNSMGMSAGYFSVFYIIMIAIYFFPLYYLYNFGVQMGNSINKSMSMDSAFENLKSHYKFIGIFTIVILSIYVLIFLFGIIVAIAN